MDGADELLINGNMMKVHQAGNQYLKGGDNDDEKDEGQSQEPTSS